MKKEVDLRKLKEYLSNLKESKNVRPEVNILFFALLESVKFVDNIRKVDKSKLAELSKLEEKLETSAKAMKFISSSD